MYPLVLTTHSWIRWLLLLTLLLSMYRGWYGWKTGRSFSSKDNTLRISTVTIAHIQLLIGLWLYFISPLVQYFLADFSEFVHHRELRFFGMEHITMMVIAVILITIGSARSRRLKEDHRKLKTMAIYFSIALFIIFVSIPWQFSPLVSRPYFRMF